MLFCHDSSLSALKDFNNNTLFHEAAHDNRIACLRVLLTFAPRLVDAVNKCNVAPLMWAVKNRKRDAAKILMEAGANVWRKNNDGNTVFYYAPLTEGMLEILKQDQQVSGTFLVLLKL